MKNRILSLLQEDDAGVELRRVEFVGPQVGEQLRTQGIWAIIAAAWDLVRRGHHVTVSGA